MEFSERLRELRKEKHLTQRELAQYLGLTANSICEWENRRSEPSISSLLKMSVLFETSIGYLIGQEDDFGNITVQSSSPIGERLTDNERTLLNWYRELPSEKARASFLSFISSSGEMFAAKRN